MQRAPVLSIRAVHEFDMTQAGTLAGTLPHAARSRRPRRMMVALVTGLVAIGGAIAVALGAGYPRENVEPSPAVVGEAAPVKAVRAPEPLPPAEPQIAPTAPEPVDEIPVCVTASRAEG